MPYGFAYADVTILTAREDAVNPLVSVAYTPTVLS